MNEPQIEENESLKKVISEDAIKLKSVVEYIKEHLEVVTIIGVLLSAIFNFGSYVYSMGIYDFWNIPYLYITNNTENILVKFVLSAGMGIILFVIATLYIMRIKERIEGKGLWKIICIFLLYFLKLLGAVAVFWFVALCVMASPFEAFLYVVYFPILFLKQSLVLSFVVFFFFCVMGSAGCILIFPDMIDFTKVRELKNPMIWCAIGIIIVICCTAVTIYAIFDCGRTSVENEKKLSVVTIQGEEYVVINRYDDTWIVKPYISDESGWRIDLSHYGFEDLKGIPLDVRTINRNDSLSNHLFEADCELSTNGDKEDSTEEMGMLNFSMWCNQNEGFISAILTIVALLLSALTIIMTYRLGTMPYKKKISFVPFLYEKEGEFYIDLTVINCGNATICIQSLDILNNEKLHIGKAEDLEYVTLKPCDYIQKSIRLYDDVENIEKNWIDLNGHIVITAYDVDGRQYKASKDFPVG